MIPSKLSNCIIAVFMFMWFYFFSTKKIMKNIPTAFVEKIFPFANVGFGLVVTLILWSLACNTEEKKRRFQNMISEENLNVAGKCVLSWRPEGCHVKDDEGGRGAFCECIVRMYFPYQCVPTCWPWQPAWLRIRKEKSLKISSLYF